MGMAIESYGYQGKPNESDKRRHQTSNKISGSIAKITDGEQKSLSSQKVREILHTAWDHLNLDESILPEKD